MGTSSIFFLPRLIAGGYLMAILGVYPYTPSLEKPRNLSTVLRNYCDVCGNLGAVCDITPSQADFFSQEWRSMTSPQPDMHINVYLSIYVYLCI